VVEIILILIGVLAALTIGAALEYYRELRIIRREYEKARDVLKDIILSFNRQLRQEAGKVERVAYKLEVVSAKSGSVSERMINIERKMELLESRVKQVTLVGFSKERGVLQADHERYK